VLAGLDGGKVPRGVQGIGERVVDRLDLAVGEDVGVGAERSLYPARSVRSPTIWALAGSP